MGPQKLPKSSFGISADRKTFRIWVWLDGGGISTVRFWILGTVMWLLFNEVWDNRYEMTFLRLERMLYWFQGLRSCKKIKKLGQSFKIKENFKNNLRQKFFSLCKVENNSNSFDDISFASTNKVYGFPIVVVEQQQGIPSKHVNFHVKIDKSCFHFVVRWKCSSTLLRYVFSSPAPFFTYGRARRRHIWTSDYEL